MIKPYVPMVLFDPGLNETSYLSNVDPSTLAERMLCFQARVILERKLKVK
jgi:hypothetical protein